jgi:outer membrane lipopolysaccharide assembly protein LptE/RlpB
MVEYWKVGFLKGYHQKYIWAVIIIPLFFSACGYRFAGSGNLPGGIQTIAIEIFENRTPETGLENTITNGLIYEFTRKGRKVQKNSKMADAILTGVIGSERITTISRQAQQSPLERRVVITVNLKLTGSDGEVKWSATGVSEFQEYNVASDKEATETNKRRAIETLSKKLAEKIHNRLTDNF